MSAPKGDVPSLGVLVTGGIGVLVVVAFVTAIAFGRESRIEPGDRIAVVRVDDKIEIVAARCPDERVRAVEVRPPGGSPLWRVESVKGTIDRVFVVGDEPPALFETVVPFEGQLPPGRLEAEVTVDDVVDVKRFDVATLAPTDEVGVACDDGDLGIVPFVFVVGALGVVLAYGAMALRYVRDR